MTDAVAVNVNAAGISDPGRVRSVNQDSYLVSRSLNLYAVADGVESTRGSEMASKMAVELLEKQLKAVDISEDATPPFDDKPGIPLAARALKYAVREVNREIYKFGRENPKLQGVGTTLTAVWVCQGRAFIGHVGDSRAYLIRNSILTQLTSDHTTLAERNPDQNPDLELYQQPENVSEHELSRALGINPDVQVQLGSGLPAPGDHFVLCTDGLYGQIRDFEINQITCKDQPQTACRKMVQLANQRGGRDNIAVVVISIE